MIRYPRQVKTPAGEAQVAGAEEFLAYYDEIFTLDFRKKLEEKGMNPDCIKTVRGVGYKFQQEES